MVRRVSSRSVRRLTGSTLDSRFLASLPDHVTPCGDKEGDPFEVDLRLGRVIRYVDAHLSDELRLESLASAAAMTPSSFRRYFHQHVGMSFRQWLVSHRVAHARRLLRRCDMTVAAVGRTAGFSCSRTFRRVFRARSGCSPSQYRTRYLATAVPAGKRASWTTEAHVGPPPPNRPEQDRRSDTRKE